MAPVTVTAFSVAVMSETRNTWPLMDTICMSYLSVFGNGFHYRVVNNPVALSGSGDLVQARVSLFQISSAFHWHQAHSPVETDKAQFSFKQLGHRTTYGFPSASRKFALWSSSLGSLGIL